MHFARFRGILYNSIGTRQLSNDISTLQSPVPREELADLLWTTKLPLCQPDLSLRGLYHAILVQLRAFPDAYSAEIVKRLVRDNLQRHKRDSTPQRMVLTKKNLRRCLITLQKSNLGDLKSFRKVIESAYGQRGRLRHQYLAPIAAARMESSLSSELIPGKTRSRLPLVTSELMALWRLQFEEKKLHVSLPLGPGGIFGKPLDRRREANIRWQHYTDLLAKTRPPLPLPDLHVLQLIVDGSSRLNLVGVPAWRKSTIETMTIRGELKSSDPHRLQHRTLQRLYAQVLSRSPVFLRNENGSLYAKAASIDKSKSSTTSDSCDTAPEVHFPGVLNS